jgi:phage protein D
MSDLAPEFRILLNGSPVEDMDKLHVQSLEYEDNLKSTSSVQFSLSESSAYALDPARLQLGNELELEIGYHGNLVKVFNGEIFRVSPECSRGETPKLKVLAYDRSYLLKKMGIPRIYTQPNPLLAVKDIISRYPGLTSEVDPQNLLADYKIDSDKGLAQIDQTDWEVLDIIARIGNYEMFVRGKVFYMVSRDYLIGKGNYRKRTLRFNPSSSLEAEDIVILGFNSEMGSDNQRLSIEVIGWGSVGAKGEKKGTITLPELRTKSDEGYTIVKIRNQTVETLRITGKIARTEPQARQLAVAELQRRANALVKASFQVPGSPGVFMGQEVDVQLNTLGSFGEQHSGTTYFINGIKHSFGTDGFVTTISTERDGVTTPRKVK